MNVLLFFERQIWLHFLCHANVSLSLYAYGPVKYNAQIERKEIASVHFDDLFFGWFTCNDLKRISW